MTNDITSVAAIDPFERAMQALCLAGLEPTPVAEWSTADRLAA